MTTIDHSKPHLRTPPSDHAMGRLSRAAEAAFPSQEVNFTVRDKLCVWGYATIETRPSPYKTHKPGHRVQFLVITDAGRQALAQWEEARANRGRRR